MSFEIIDTLLYQLDINDTEPMHIPFSSKDHNDLPGYLAGLLKEISEKDSRREFEFEATGAFKQFMSALSADPNLKEDEIGKSLSTRLLDKEKNAESTHGHLKGNRSQLISKGSYLQLTYKESDEYYYIGVKVEHQPFLDDIDFKTRIGLSFENKLYKAVKLKLNPAPSDIYVFDTNSRVSTYWWKEFLELKEKRSDSFNSKEACKWTIVTINKIKKEHPADYTILRNATIAAFKQKGDFDYFNFVDATFKNYESDDATLLSKLQTVYSDLKDLPKKKGFDTTFKTDPSSIPYRRQKFSLSHEIDLAYDEGIQNLSSKIWAHKTQAGKECVVIYSPEGYEHFKKISHEE